MATSSTFSTDNQYIKYRIVVTEQSTSIENNTSTVNVKVDAWRTNTGYTTYGTGTCYCTIDGTSYSQSISASQTITHNSHTVLLNKTVTIQHGADGRKNIYVQAKISHQRFSSSYHGFTVSLSDIPRKATITAVQNFTDEGNPILAYNNPAGAVVDSLQACISLDGTTASIAYRDVEKLGSSYQFNLTTAERNVLLASIPNTNSGTVYFILKTEIAGVVYTDSKQATFSVVNASPVISGASYKDNYSATVAITGNDQKIIQNKSDLLFLISSITAQKSASLVSMEITLNSITQTQSLSGASASNVSLDFGVINVAEDITATIKITDSRGNTAETAVNVSVYAWQAPSAICKATRLSNYYAQTTIFCDADISSLGGNNQLTITWYYKEKTASTYTTGGNLVDGGSATISLDNEKAFDVKFEITDVFATTIYIIPVEIGIPIFFIDKDLRSCGAGTMPDESNMFAVDRRLQLKNTLHEAVAELWSSVVSDTYHTAYFYIKDQNGNTLLNLGGDISNGYGYLITKNANGNALVSINRSTAQGGWLGIYDQNGGLRASLFDDNGSHLWMANSNGDYIGGFYTNTYNDGGAWELMNASGNQVAECFADGTDDDGILNLRDSSGNLTIHAKGSTGEIECKKIKASEGVEELFTGTFDSGSTTFNYGNYNLYIVKLRVSTNGNYQTMTIPKIDLNTTDTDFQFNTESNFFSFKLKYSGNVCTMTYKNRTSDSTAYIEKVYGVN